jgi:hypothetical protein
VRLTLPEARYVCGCGHVFHGPFKCCGGDAFRLPDGMHLVSDADVQVLEACSAFPTEHLTGDAYPSSSNRNELSDLSLRWSQAELARREAK